MEEKIKELLLSKSFREIKEIFCDLQPADAAAVIAELFEEAEIEKDIVILYRLLPKDLAAETFAFFEADIQKMLIEGFSDQELKDILEQTFVDDMVDMLEEMPANIVKRILSNSAPETRKAINEILKYPEDSAGSMMTIEYIELLPSMTVADAFLKIKRTGVDKETIYTCYVKDKNRKLIGFVTAKSLLLSEADDIIEDIMETNIISVNTHEDREVVSEMMSKYDFLALPVVDAENRLVGIVTVDDVVDVILEEATEDIEKMAAITPSDKPYLKIGIFETWKQRIPWLLILMISATFTGGIIDMYTDSLASCAILTTFIPMFMGTGGNAGSQASVTIIRGLSINEIEFSDWLKIVWKELRVACLCGITLAFIYFVALVYVMKIELMIAVVVGLTLIITVIAAKLVGCTLPMLAKKIGFDPAVMASPFITTIVDTLSLVIFFRIAVMILGI